MSWLYMIPPDTIKQILDAARIEEVVGDFIQLRKKNDNYVGLCPFHTGKYASLSISPSKKIFKCFACGEGGNVISFLQKYKHLSYVESLQYLADKYGINLYPQEESTKQLHESPFNRQKSSSQIIFIDTEVGIDSQKVQDYGAVREDGAVIPTTSTHEFETFV